MFIIDIKILQKKQNEIHMEHLASGKHIKNGCFLRTLKFKMIGRILLTDLDEIKFVQGLLKFIYLIFSLHMKIN
jgi:hypothetical protein